MSLVIDLRCLQDVNYYGLGIGQHTLSLLRQAPGRFIGIIDPAMPPLPNEAAALVPELSPHAYIPGARVFLNPCPFGSGQAYLARLLTDPAVLKAACVYDFIPFDDQATYLGDTGSRLDYFTAMAWLKRYDVFLPISVPTEARLRELYGDVRSVVTGVALPPWVHSITPQAPRYILMIGGNDPRKNPELLAATHAASPVLRRLKLVITGHVAPERAARLRAITALELPGRVSDETLRDTVRAGLCRGHALAGGRILTPGGGGLRGWGAIHRIGHSGAPGVCCRKTSCSRWMTRQRWRASWRTCWPGARPWYKRRPDCGGDSRKTVWRRRCFPR